MNRQQLRHVLDELAAREVPDHTDLWPGLQARLSAPATPRPRTRAVVHWGRALAAVGLALVMAATVYAAGNLWEALPFWQPVASAGLGEELHLTQSLNGYRVTLERAYADANQILVGFTIAGPDASPPLSARARLTDEAGNPFPALVGGGFSGRSEVLGLSLPPGVRAEVLAFDAAGVRGAPADLALRLEIHLVGWEPATQTDDPATGTPQESGASPGESAADDRVRVEPLVPRWLAGPFTFEFRVPFVPGHRLAVAQVAEARGIEIRLEGISLTPTEARALLCYSPPTGEMGGLWVPIARLQGGGRVLEAGSSQDVGEGCHRVHFFAYDSPLVLETQRTWVLTVEELVDLAPHHREPPRLAGPWVFRFRGP